MDVGAPPKLLASRREKIILLVGLIVVAVTVALSLRYSRATPDLAAIRAVEEAAGPQAGAIRVSGRYQFEDIDGSVSWSRQLACGTVVQDNERRPFAALIYKSRRTVFEVEELAIQPPKGRSLLAREAQLLGACRG